MRLVYQNGIIKTYVPKTHFNFYISHLFFSCIQDYNSNLLVSFLCISLCKIYNLEKLLILTMKLVGGFRTKYSGESCFPFLGISLDLTCGLSKFRILQRKRSQTSHRLLNAEFMQRLYAAFSFNSHIDISCYLHERGMRGVYRFEKL